MTCPDCNTDIGTPKFGRFTCPECKSDLRITAEGVRMIQPIPKLRVEGEQDVWGHAKSRPILVCGLCQHPHIHMPDYAYISRNGGRWPIKSPICAACLSNTESVTLKDGRIVPRMKPLPRVGFHTSIMKTPEPISDDGVEQATNPHPKEYWSGFTRYCP